MADAPLSEIRDEDTAVVHHERDAHLVAHLAKNVSNNGIEEKLPELVLNRNDGLAAEARFVAGILGLPKRADERVFELADNPGPIVIIGEQSVDAKQGSVCTIEQGRDGVVEDVFQARPPRVAPDAFEGADDAGCDEVSVIGRDVCEQVQPDGEFEVARAEIN